jgi:hypothetical protein
MIDTSNMDTNKLLENAKNYALKNKIKEIVIATTTGETGVLASQIFNSKFTLIAVTHSTGFKNKGDQELLDKNKKKMLENNVKIFTGPMIFHSWNDYYRKRYGAIMPTTIIADTLRIFGQGTKVAVEIILMAMDAGLISSKKVISIGGTCKGADTVILAEPSNSKKLFDIKIIDIFGKPMKW